MKVSKRLEIKNRLGLHARAAALLVQTVSRFSADVKVTKDGQVVDGRSIIGLLTLGAAKGSRVKVEAKGEDAEESLRAIEELFEQRFDEGESA
ncbi:MAG: HPr family phosphocarrier protein [Deltaproteobacteria bacterium]|nr:HPr family phosphocarrier protein [Deltaproteobacteria bacterium]